MEQPIMNTQAPSLIRVIGDEKRHELTGKASDSTSPSSSTGGELQVNVEQKAWRIQITDDNILSIISRPNTISEEITENAVCIVLNLNEKNPLNRIEAAVQYANKVNTPLYVVAILLPEVYTHKEHLQTGEIDTVLYNARVRNQPFFQKKAGFFLVDPDFREVRQLQFNKTTGNCESIGEPLNTEKQLTKEAVSNAFHPLFERILEDCTLSLRTQQQAVRHPPSKSTDSEEEEGDNSYSGDEDEDEIQTRQTGRSCSARKVFNVFRVLSILAGVSTGIAGVTNEDFADSVENSWGGGIDASNDVADNGIFPWVSLALIAFPAATYLAGYVTQKCSDLFSGRRRGHTVHRCEGEPLLNEGNGKTHYGQNP